MHTTFTRSAIKPAIALARIAQQNARGSMPVLGYVRVIANGRLTCECTDLYFTARYYAECNTSEVGETLIAVAAVHGWGKGKGSDVITLATDGLRTTVRNAGATTQLPPAIRADSWPPLPATARYTPIATFESGAFARAMRAIDYARDTDVTRQRTSALLRVSAGEAALASTDGHRLAVAKIAPFAITARTLGEWLLMPELCAAYAAVAKTVEHDIVRVSADACNVAIQLESHASCVLELIGKMPTTEEKGRTVLAQFPPYEQVIPATHGCEITVDRDALLAAVRAAEKFAPKRSGMVKLTPSDSAIVVSASDPDKGEFNKSIDATITGAPIRMGFNARYLAEALSETCDAGAVVTLEMPGDTLSPVVAYSSRERRAIVMPMRQ